MKYTQAQAMELLKKLGDADAEIVADDAADPSFDENAAISLIDDSRVSFHRPAIEAAVAESANKSATGKFSGVMMRALAKSAGMSVSELEKTPKLEEAIAIAFSKYGEKMGGDTAQVRAEYDKLLSDTAAEKERLLAEHQEAIATANRRLYDKEFRGYVDKLLKDAPIAQGADRAEVSAYIARELASAYDVQTEEKDGAFVFNLVDRNTKLHAKNKAGNGAFDYKEFAKDKLSPLGTWQTDMRNQDAGKALEQQGRTPDGRQRFDGTKDPMQQIRDMAASAAPSAKA